MTVSVQQIANTNTYGFWKDRTNELANAMSTVVVTTNSNTAIGNAAITGTFTASKFSVANTTANLSISIPTASQISNGQYYLNANGNWTLIRSPFTTGIYSTTNTSSQSFDSFQLSDANGAEYLVKIKDNNTNAYHTTKILVIHNFDVAYLTEYGTLYTNTSLGNFSVSTNSTHCVVNVATTSNNTAINFIRTSV